MVFLAHFNSKLGQGLLDTVHLNGNIPKQTFQSQELHTNMISDIVLYMYDGKGSKSSTILWHWSTVSYLMIVHAIFTGLFARPPPVLREVMKSLLHPTCYLLLLRWWPMTAWNLDGIQKRCQYGIWATNASECARVSEGVRYHHSVEIFVPVATVVFPFQNEGPMRLFNLKLWFWANCRRTSWSLFTACPWSIQGHRGVTPTPWSPHATVLGNLGLCFHGLGHQGVSRVILPYILQKLWQFIMICQILILYIDCRTV